MLNISPPPISAFGRTAGTIASVQSKSANTGAASAGLLNLVFDSTPTAGNIIVLAIANNGAVGDITGTNINFSAILRTGVNNTFALLAFGRVLASASATIVIDNNGSSNTAVVGAEYSGGSLLRLDMMTAANGSSASPASGATNTTTTGAELWVGAIAARGTNANTMSAPTNGFSIVAQTNTTTAVANTDRTVGLFAQIVTGTGAPNCGCTLSGSNSWAAIAASFEETPLIFLNN